MIFEVVVHIFLFFWTREVCNKKQNVRFLISALVRTISCHMTSIFQQQNKGVLFWGWGGVECLAVISLHTCRTAMITWIRLPWRSGPVLRVGRDEDSRFRTLRSGVPPQTDFSLHRWTGALAKYTQREFVWTACVRWATLNHFWPLRRED